MRNLNKILIILTAILVAQPVLADNKRKYDPYQVNRQTERVEMLLLLNGIKNTYECSIPATDRGTVLATCHDHDVIDLRTNKIIGTAVDATADVDAVDSGFVATGTTSFYLKNGSFVIRARGSIQPILEGAPVLDGSPVTHIAGIFPQAGDNHVLSGTGVYRHASGTFNLLGALDLTNSSVGQSAFHCIYTINLDLNRRH